jgi:peptide/nickel transport system substrate-binding protein
VAHRSRGLTLSVAALASAALMLTACSGKAAPSQQSGDATSGSSDTELMTTTPQAKGPLDQVVWNLWEGEPYTVDPYTSADYKENTVNSNMCETLLAIKPDLTIAPNLATSWDNPDPLTWELHLRDDVTFWDGSPMTADDVVFSMNKNLTDGGSFYNYLYGRVASVKASGAHDVTVKLKKPDYVFINELADYAGVVVQKKFYEAHPKDVGTAKVGVMCTGPFKFTSWTQGDNITLTKYDGYWDKSRAPKVTKLVFKFLTDDAAITNALLAGQIDGAYDPPLSATEQLKGSGVGNLYFGRHESNMTMVYSNAKGAMSNPKLRQALQMAVDWDGIAKTLLKGTGEPIRSMMPTTVYSYAQETLMKAYQQLPEPKSAQYDAAKKLVAEAGADASTKVVMAVPASFTAQQFGNSVADAAKRIGMNFQLKVVPTDQYTNYLYDPKTRAGVDILFTDFWPNIPDPMDWLGIAALDGGSFNQYGYSGIDELYGKAQAEKDPEARAAIIGQIQQKTTADLLPMVPGISHSSRLWMNKRVTGAPASFDYVYYPWAATLGSAS